MQLKILADKGDEQKVIEEEKAEWVFEVLLALDINEQAFELNMEDLRDHLKELGIEVWNKYDGSVDIYRDEKIIAQWKVPNLVLVKDPKRWYYEIYVNNWALPLQSRD
jgi:hypothetical protein